MKKRRRTSKRPTAPFRWAGGKAHLMPRLIPHIANHIRYVSVFGGAGSDLFNKPRSKVEVFNDIHGDIVNFFRLLRNDKKRKQLCFMLQHTPLSRVEFVNCLAVLQSNESDPLERAWAFLTSSLLGFSGIDPGIASAGNFCRTFKRRSWENSFLHIERVAQRFHAVALESLPWQDILRCHDGPDTFFYLDPPYLPETRVSKKLYKHEMTVHQHVELLETLQAIKGMAMVSGYPSKLYEAYFASWRRVEFMTRCYMASHTKKKPDRTEVIWMNYGKDGRRLCS
ncbi:MAG: DNA adenine methylase [Planctomycetaceae bacterium]|nr:DNA adenine methylase [Planctomycetaceae bacterium]